MHLDEDGRIVEWDDLPLSLDVNMEQDYELVTSYPLEMLNFTLNELIDSTRGMRPHAEIAELIK